jgi:2-polyprenyl-6-methoxyphenol hydroxylase-like FAD-dependent oxidoreductase
MPQNTAPISGAGIAGPATAFWLNAAGWKTTIVERASGSREGGYVIDFWGLGYDLAERMGLSDEIERVGYHVRELRVIGDHGERLAGFGTSVFTELTGGRYVTLARRDLSRLLLASIVPATNVIFDDEIATLNHDADSVGIQLRSGSSHRFDLVVGADGLHSKVRHLAFGPDEEFERPLDYMIAAFEAQDYHPRDPDIYMMYGKPGRMIGRFTLHDDQSLFLFVFAFEGTVPATLDEQKALLVSLYQTDGWESAKILNRLEKTQDLYLDRVSQIVATSWSIGRVVLVGDAAFCPSLLAGQGSALAIVAAYVLAGELTRTPGRIDDALVAYERLLRPYIATKQAGASRFAGAFAPRSRFGLWFRNMIIRALVIPGIARIAIGREIVDRLQLPDYPI